MPGVRDHKATDFTLSLQWATVHKTETRWHNKQYGPSRFFYSRLPVLLVEGYVQ